MATHGTIYQHIQAAIELAEDNHIDEKNLLHIAAHIRHMRDDAVETVIGKDFGVLDLSDQQISLCCQLAVENNRLRKLAGSPMDITDVAP